MHPVARLVSGLTTSVTTGSVSLGMDTGSVLLGMDSDPPTSHRPPATERVPPRRHRFCLHVETGGGERQALLEVVEVNPFRHLSHIALRLAAASDADLKHYLAKTIKTLKVPHLPPIVQCTLVIE